MTLPAREQYDEEYERIRRTTADPPVAADRETIMIRQPGMATTERRSVVNHNIDENLPYAAGVASSRTVVRDVAAQRRRSVALVTQILWFIVGLIEAMLALRFVLLLFGANPDAAFAQLIYGISGALAAPFIGIFPAIRMNSFELDPASLVAMLVYFLLGLGVARLIWILYGEPRDLA
jgi:uncharacterized protein YggT (Ycf19 family)